MKRNQLFCATSSLFQVFAAWTAILSLGPAFELLEEAATAFGGTKGEYLFCYMYFCVQKIILNTSTSPAAALSHRWVVKNHPQPTLFVVFDSRCGRPGVEQMPILVYWVECWSNIITPSSTCSIPAKSTKTSTSSKPHSFWLRYELQGEVSFMGK